MKILGIYDSPEYNDRYTVVYDEPATTTGETLTCLGMTESGNYNHGSAQLGDHLGKQITFQQLPTNCQKAVWQDISAELPQQAARVLERMVLGRAA